MRYEMKKVFETIEPSSIERQNMLTNIFAQSQAKAKQERKQNNFFARRMTALAASLVLVIGVSAVGLRLLANDNYNAGAGADFDGTEIEQPTIPTGPEIYSQCGILIGAIDEQPEDAELQTINFDGAKELTLTPIGDIIVITSADIEELEISFYNHNTGSRQAEIDEFLLNPNDVHVEYNKDFSVYSYYNDYPYKTGEHAHFSREIGDGTISVVYVTLSENQPLDQLRIITANHVLIEDCNAAKKLLLTGHEGSSFTVSILNSHFDVANIQANADVTVKDSSFLGLYPKVMGEIGLYYNNQNDDGNSIITFENSKATGLYTNGTSTNVNVSNSELGQFIQDAYYEGARNNFTNIINSTIEDLLLLNSFGFTAVVTDSEIKYLVALGATEHQVKFDGADVSVFGFKSVNCTVENVIGTKAGTGIYKDGELIPWELYNISTGELQGDMIIPEGATRSTTPEPQ